MTKYILLLVLLACLSHQGYTQTFRFPCDGDNIGKSSFNPHKKLNRRDSVYAIDTNKIDFIFRYRIAGNGQIGETDDVLAIYHYKKHDTWKAFHYEFYKGYNVKKYKEIVRNAEIKKNVDYKQLWDSLKAHDIFIMPNTTLQVRPPTEAEKNERAIVSDGDCGFGFELITKKCYHTYGYAYHNMVGGMYHTAAVIQFMKMQEFMEEIKDPTSTKFLKH